MKRFRWPLLLLAGVVVIGASSSVVLARSNATADTTYWNNAVSASEFDSAGDWLGYGQTATWTFNDLSGLRGGLNGSAALNFAGFSKTARPGGGSGYSTQMTVVVTGVGAGTFTTTTTLNNPWRPHVAYSNDEGTGWAAYASVSLPTYMYQNAISLTVKVKSITSNTLMMFPENTGLLIGYTTIGF